MAWCSEKRGVAKDHSPDEEKVGSNRPTYNGSMDHTS